MSKALENYHKKRTLIVMAAKKLFLTEGYRATSMDRVATTAGVTKQTIYRYFASKAELFRATMETLAGGAKGSYCFGDGEVRSELLGFGSAFLTFHMDRERLDIMRLIVAESPKDKELAHTFFDAGPKGGWVAILTLFIENRLSPNESPRVLAKLYCTMMLSMRMPILLGIREVPDQGEISSHVETVVDFFLKGCGC
jgi:AcrR family transcriptional regulator